MAVQDMSKFFNSTSKCVELPSKGAVYINDSNLAFAFVFYLKEVYGRESNSDVSSKIRSGNFKAICWNTMTVWTISNNTSMPEESIDKFIYDMEEKFNNSKYYMHPFINTYKDAIKKYKSKYSLSGIHGSSDIIPSQPNVRNIDIKTNRISEGINYPSLYNHMGFVDREYINNQVTSNNPCSEIKMLTHSDMLIPTSGFIEVEEGDKDHLKLLTYLSKFGYKYENLKPSTGTIYLYWYLIESSGNSKIRFSKNNRITYNHKKIRAIDNTDRLYKIIEEHSKLLNNNQNGKTSENINSKGIDVSINRRKRKPRNPVVFGGCGKGFEAKYRVRRKGCCKIGERKRSEGNGLHPRRGVKRLVTI